MSDTAPTGVTQYRASLTALVPAGWLVRESLELAAPGAKARVGASGDYLDEATDLDEYARRYAELLERLPGYEELGLEEVSGATGERALLRRFRWTPEGGDAISELQLYSLAAGRGICATASALESDLPSLEAQLREVLRAISVAGVAAPGGLVRADASPRARTYEALERGELAAARGNGGAEVVPEQPRWEEARAAWEAAADEVRAP